jgi:hypothetical protein
MKTTIATLWRTDARLTAVGFAMLALLAATAVALLVDPREVLGAPLWMKPAKFAASIAIYTLTLAWVFTYLPEWPKTRRTVSWVTTVTLLLEIVIIDLQAWRGTTSHFNVGTVVDGVLFTTMGLAIVAQTLASVAGTGWSREHGDLRVAHFIGLHAIQMLSLVALVLTSLGWPEARRIRIVWAVTASYASLFALLMWQALRGQSVIAPASTTLTALAWWAVLTALALGIAGPRRDTARAHAALD